MTPSISHDPAHPRFVTEVDGQQAVLEYRMRGDTMELTHTGVPAPIGGRGIAGALVRAAFEHARAHGLRVRPLCSYAAAWAERHDDVRDLLA
ncbi:MAG TPA: GNAT family N-acetyltransferase [Lysobacter sp.]|nr:GNAT family N-acetyltransferase [Lysobacter sp.]